MNVEKKRNGDLPVMYDSEKIITRTSWHNNEILVAEIENYMSEETPEYFRINHYAILFITQGTLSGIFNQIGIEMKAPAAAFIFNDHVLHYISSSPDLKIRLLSFSPVIAEKLMLSLPYDKLHYAYVRPASQIDAPNMQTIMLYLDLVEELMRKETPNRQTTILHLIRSLISVFGGSMLPRASRHQMVCRRTAPDAHVCGQCGETGDGQYRRRLHQRNPDSKSQVAVADLHAFCPGDFRPPRLPEPEPFRHLLPPCGRRESEGIQDRGE